MTNIDTNIFFYEGTNLTLILTMLLKSSKCWRFLLTTYLLCLVDVLTALLWSPNVPSLSTNCSFIRMRQTSCPTHIVLCFVCFFRLRLCCQFLWIIHFLLPLRISLTFIHAGASYEKRKKKLVRSFNFTFLSWWTSSI